MADIPIYTTPSTQTTLRATRGHQRPFAPRSSQTTGQGWGVLAFTHQQEGVLERDLRTLLEGMLFGFWKASIHVCANRTHLAFLVQDGSMLIGWTNRPIPDFPTGRLRRRANLSATQGIVVAFSPLVYRAHTKALQSGWPSKDSTYVGLPPFVVSSPHTPSGLDRTIGEAVADAQAMGPVHAPWNLPQGGLTAPWFLGYTPTPLLDSLILAGAEGLGLAEPGVQFELTGLTLDRQGSLVWDDWDVMRTRMGSATRSCHPLTHWLAARLKRPGCPIPLAHLVAHAANEARHTSARHRLHAGVLAHVACDMRPTAHRRMEIRRLWSAANAW